MKIRKGTSIIEIVIAAALISVSIISALSLANRSQQQNSYSRVSSEATKYTSQGADWVRSQRDLFGFATLANAQSGEYCLNTFPSDFTQLEATTCGPLEYIPNTVFARSIIIDNSQVGSGIIKISVVIRWTEKTDRQTQIDLELTSWY